MGSSKGGSSLVLETRFSESYPSAFVDQSAGCGSSSPPYAHELKCLCAPPDAAAEAEADTAAPIFAEGASVPLLPPPLPPKPAPAPGVAPAPGSLSAGERAGDPADQVR